MPDAYCFCPWEGLSLLPPWFMLHCLGDGGQSTGDFLEGTLGNNTCEGSRMAQRRIWTTVQLQQRPQPTPWGPLKQHEWPWMALLLALNWGREPSLGTATSISHWLWTAQPFPVEPSEEIQFSYSFHELPNCKKEEVGRGREGKKRISNEPWNPPCFGFFKRRHLFYWDGQCYNIWNYISDSLYSIKS